MSDDATDTAKAVVILVALGLLVLAGVFVVFPLYGVWQQGMAGKAELQKAEYTRRVAVLEAQAKADSASKYAEAEVARARGVAEANRIIGQSLENNKAYLQYLYITGIQEGSEKGNRTIYVPTEGGMPVPTLDTSK
jgi:hypothetical protein